ncbi:MAG: hypothetical protein ACLRZ9_02360 [Eubacterium sp.]
MNQLVVGNYYEDEKTNLDVAGMGITLGSVIINIAKPNLSESIIEQIRECTPQVRIWLHNQVMHTLIKFGDVEWIEMSFNIVQQFTTLAKLRELIENIENIPMVIKLFDSSTGQLKVLRVIQMEKEWNRLIKSTILMQLRFPISIMDYGQKVIKNRGEYTPQEMERMAESFTVLKEYKGENFNEIVNNLPEAGWVCMSMS